MQALDILIEDPRWDAVDLARLTEAVCARAFDQLGLVPDAVELTVMGCDDGRIAALNGDFRGKDQPTNVLSWPAEELAADTPGADPRRPEAGPDGMVALGDIALSYDTCAAEANAAGRSLADHASHLILHGVLHLLGYDHISDPDAALMEGLETKILGKMGIDDPYKEG